MGKDHDWVRLTSTAGKQLVLHVREKRMAWGVEESTMAAWSGMSTAELQRFEAKGEGDRIAIMRLCHALMLLDEFDRVFAETADAR